MAIPKYQYIKDELKNKIISGQFASGDKFYTEAELIAMYDVSSITVVRALNDLAKDGYIAVSYTHLDVYKRQDKFNHHWKIHPCVEFNVATFHDQTAHHVTWCSTEKIRKD